MAEILYAGDYSPVTEALHKTEVGRRLRAAIEALGITQTEVGHALNTSQSKLGNWLRGDNYPAEWFIKQFCDRYGVTTEWIYRGIVSGMPPELANVLWMVEQAGVRSVKETSPAGRQAGRAKKKGDGPPPLPTKPKGADPPRPTHRGTGQKIKVSGTVR